MRRKNKARSGAKARKSKPVGSPQLTRSDTPRRRHGQSSLIPSRRRVRRLDKTPERSRSLIRESLTRNRLPDRLRDRRDNLHGRKPVIGLPSAVLQERRLNENASRQKTTRSVCTRKKETRRAVIVANGYGGINNVRDYRSHQKCR